MNFQIGLFVPTWKKNYNNVSASIWIRCFEFAKFLKDQGHKVSINNYFKNYDFCIVYRECSDLTLLKLKFLKKRSKHIFWDTCVNYLDPHPNNNQKRINIVKNISGYIDAVICSSRFIFDRHRAEGYNAILFEDCIKHCDVKTVKESNMFTWCGISSKFVSLNKYFSILDGNITVISDKKFKNCITHKFVEWNYNTFFNYTSSSNIAFLPRDYNNPYDSGHSSYKALCFAAFGVPIISNKLPSYIDLNNRYDGIFFLEEIDYLKEFAFALCNNRFCNKRLLEYYSYSHQSYSLFDFINTYN